MKEIKNSLLNESYYKYTLPNGLTVFLYHKPLLKRSYAMLTVKYGSIHQEFKFKVVPWYGATILRTEVLPVLLRSTEATPREKCLRLRDRNTGSRECRSPH